MGSRTSARAEKGDAAQAASRKTVEQTNEFNLDFRIDFLVARPASPAPQCSSVSDVPAKVPEARPPRKPGFLQWANHPQHQVPKNFGSVEILCLPHVPLSNRCKKPSVRPESPRVLECGGKPSATPLSLNANRVAQDILSSASVFSAKAPPPPSALSAHSKTPCETGCEPEVAARSGVRKQSSLAGSKTPLWLIVSRRRSVYLRPMSNLARWIGKTIGLLKRKLHLETRNFRAERAVALAEFLALAISGAPRPALAASSPSASGDGPVVNWPRWRGPNDNGSIEGGTYPVKWDATNGLMWKAPLPGKGCSTPAVWNRQIYVTAASEGRNAVLAFDASGRQLWLKTLGPENPGKHKNGSGSNPSPSTDGQNLFLYFKNGDLAAFDLQGQPRWTTNLSSSFGPRHPLLGHGHDAHPDRE